MIAALDLMSYLAGITAAGIVGIVVIAAHTKGEGRVMKDKYLVTLEIDTYDGDPRWWDWEKLSTGEDVIKIISSEFKGRVLPTEGKGE